MDLKGIFAASYLQQYWTYQFLIFVVLFIYSVGTGAVWDKSQGHRKAEDRIGWFEFRKRYRCRRIID